MKGAANGAGAKAPVSLMAGYFRGIAVEPPRPLGDFTRYTPHRGSVSWYAVKTDGGWIKPLEPLTER